MKIFKFGGASTASIDRIYTLKNIVAQSLQKPMLLVISAMGKTTNALEKVVEAYFDNQPNTAITLFTQLKNDHLATAQQLIQQQLPACEAVLLDIFTEVEWLLHDKPVRDYDYYYDQIVCSGELMSSCIISYFLQEQGIDNEWLDVRDVLKTDNNFRDATINWQKSQQQVDTLLQRPQLYVTQGFIGATDENESTTLGREGSDYTAAIFAYLCKAQSVSIWKDVPGVMNADPKLLPDAQVITHLSYDEVIEMAYYGAQVIHPKTVQPLQKSNTPLYVKCFLDSTLPGTVINNVQVRKLPPIIVIKNNQVLLQLQTTDLSFVADQHMIELYSAFSEVKLRPNMIQTGAVSVLISVDNRKEKIEQLALLLSAVFDVQVATDLCMTTIRHYNEAVKQQWLHEKKMVLEQCTEHTWQVLYKN